MGLGTLHWSWANLTSYTTWAPPGHRLIGHFWTVQPWLMLDPPWAPRMFPFFQLSKCTGYLLSTLPLYLKILVHVLHLLLLASVLVASTPPDGPSTIDTACSLGQNFVAQGFQHRTFANRLLNHLHPIFGHPKLGGRQSLH